MLIITTIIYYGDLLALIVMMIVSMVSFSDQLNLFVGDMLELDVEEKQQQ